MWSSSLSNEILKVSSLKCAMKLHEVKIMFDKLDF